MADKDWLKSFPKGYKKIAEYIEFDSYDFAMNEFEKKISRKLNKNETILQAISNIAGELVNSGLFFKPSELDKLFSKHLGNIPANRDWKNYAKDAVKLGVLQNRTGDYKESMLSHFFQKVVEKECTEKIWNTSPIEKEHGFKINQVREKIRSKEFKQKIQSFVSRLARETQSKLDGSKAIKENPKIEEGRFNFLNMNGQRGRYAS